MVRWMLVDLFLGQIQDVPEGADQKHPTQSMSMCDEFIESE